MCHRGGRGIRLLSSITNTVTIKPTWDPAVSLTLNHPTLILLERCRTTDHFKQILAQMMRNNLIGQTFPMSRLLYFSAISHPENLDTATLLFDYFTPNPNLYIYNTLISAFSSVESFAFYISMLRDAICPDEHTLLHLLQASKHLREAEQVHCQAIVRGFVPYVYLQNSLIKLLLENGLTDCAYKVFEEMTEPDAVSFNIMINGYAKRGYSLEAIKFFREMLDFGLEPDGFTMSGLLMSCGTLGLVRLGKSVHAWIQRKLYLFSSNLILGNALLGMYTKCKELEIARKVFSSLKEKDAFSWNIMISGYANAGELELACTLFNKMGTRDLVSWNSIIAGYAQKGDYETVRTLLHEMLSEGTVPDDITVINLVSAITDIGAISQGRSTHGYALRTQWKMDAFVGSALIDMYSKFGSVDTAFDVFRLLEDKDVTVWTTMITGFALHGYGSRALDLFFEMQKYVMPNHVTLVAALTACSHSGLVDDGLEIFYSMKDTYNVEPGVEHYGCVVDLLARSGKLDHAIRVMDQMPMKPSRSIWGSVLAACKACGDIEMAELALKELIQLEPEKEGGYILLSNMYASSGKWRYSHNLRDIMESRGVKKTPGFSSLIVDEIKIDFVAAGVKHPRWIEIQHVLACLRAQMKTQDNLLLRSIQEPS